MIGRETYGPVMVAMSGGVDSSVAAALLLEAGHGAINLMPNKLVMKESFANHIVLYAQSS